MWKTIIIWGVVCVGYLWMSLPVQAASLEWGEGYQQIHLETQAVNVLTLSDLYLLDNLLLPPQLSRSSFLAAPHSQTDMLRTRESEIPVLALPESGTLFLLGLGLAGLASLIRKKKG